MFSGIFRRERRPEAMSAPSLSSDDLPQTAATIIAADGPSIFSAHRWRLFRWPHRDDGNQEINEGERRPVLPGSGDTATESDGYGATATDTSGINSASDGDNPTGQGGVTHPGALPPDGTEVSAPESGASAGDNADPIQTEEEAVQSLTSRLRCLFTILTLPIIPIGTALSLCLLFVLYAALVTDAHHTCSAPLHAYAIASLCLFIYAPYHKNVKLFLFRYSRERDGPARPPTVRIYDQLFQTMCFLYVYSGMTLMQICADDETTVPVTGADKTGGGGGAAAAVAGAIGLGGRPAVWEAGEGTDESSVATTMSTCEVTCPAIYASTQTFVTTLQIFAIILILPLLCLPCIYVWVVRRASAVAALAELGRAGTDDSDALGSLRHTATDILNEMDVVKFFRLGSDKVEVVTISPGADLEEGRLPLTSANTLVRRNSNRFDYEDVRECCICMTEFRIGNAQDFLRNAELVQLGASAEDQEENPLNTIVRTKCGHFFHRSCMLGWLGGRWNEAGTRIVTRSGCPLCRNDLAPTVPDTSDSSLVRSASAALLDSGLM